MLSGMIFCLITGIKVSDLALSTTTVKSQFNEMLQFLDSEAAAGYENILEVSK